MPTTTTTTTTTAVKARRGSGQNSEMARRASLIKKRRESIKGKLRRAVKKAAWLAPDLVNPRSSAARARGLIFFGLTNAKLDAFRRLFNEKSFRRSEAGEDALPGVDRARFAAGVKAILADTQQLGQERLYDLQQLFDEMDVDGSNLVRWDQFTSFLAAVASRRTLALVNDELKHVTLVKRPYIPEFNNFRIRTAVYAEAARVAYFVEEHAPPEVVACRVRRGGFAEVNRFKLDADAPVVAVSYIEKHSQLAFAHVDNALTLWDVRKDARFPVQKNAFVKVQSQQQQQHQQQRDPTQALSPATPKTMTQCCDANEGLVGASDEANALRSIRGLCYALEPDCLVAYGPKSGFASVWNMRTRSLQCCTRLHKHAGITCAVVFGWRLATGGADGGVVVSDLKPLLDSLGQGVIQVIHTIGHGLVKHGIQRLAFVPEHQLLVSASFENVAACWDPNVSGYVSLQMRLVGHTAPLADVCPVHTGLNNFTTSGGGATTLHAVATLDREGFLRLWDLDQARAGYDNVGLRARCLVVLPPSSSFRPTAILLAWDRALIALNKHRAQYLEPASKLDLDMTAAGRHDDDDDDDEHRGRTAAGSGDDEEQNMPSRGDDAKCSRNVCSSNVSSKTATRVCVAASSWTAQLMVVESRRAWLVDAVNMGELRTSTQWTQAPPKSDAGLDMGDGVEIAAAVACPRLRKLFVGTTAGDVRAYSVAVGAQAAAYESHLDRVVFLAFFGHGDDILFSVGADRTIAVHDGRVAPSNEDRVLPRDNKRARLRAVKNAHEQPIVAADASRSLSRLATASGDSSVRLWDVCTLKLVAVFSVNVVESEPVAVAFLDPTPAVAVAEATRAILVLPVPVFTDDVQLKHDFDAPLFRLVDASEHGLAFSCVALVAAASNRPPALYAGDESGYLRFWRLGDTVHELAPVDVPRHLRGHVYYKPRTELPSWSGPADTLRAERRGELHARLEAHVRIFAAVEQTLSEPGWTKILQPSDRSLHASSLDDAKLSLSSLTEAIRSDDDGEVANRDSVGRESLDESRRKLTWKGLRGAVRALAPVSRAVRDSFDESTRSLASSSFFSSRANSRRSKRSVVDLAPSGGRRVHYEAVTSVCAVDFSSSMVVTASQTSSIMLWDADLRPVGCVFGVDDPARALPLRVEPQQHTLLRLVKRGMDDVFHRVSAAIVQAEDESQQKQEQQGERTHRLVAESSQSFRSTATDAASSSRRDGASPPTLRSTCLEAIHGVSRPQTAPSPWTGGLNDDAPVPAEAPPEYRHLAAELTHTMNAKLCYRMRTRDVVTNLVAASASPGKRGQNFVKARRLCDALDTCDDALGVRPTEYSLPSNLFTDSEMAENNTLKGPEEDGAHLVHQEDARSKAHHQAARARDREREKARARLDGRRHGILRPRCKHEPGLLARGKSGGKQDPSGATPEERRRKCSREELFRAIEDDHPTLATREREASEGEVQATVARSQQYLAKVEAACAREEREDPFARPRRKTHYFDPNRRLSKVVLPTQASVAMSTDGTVITQTTKGANPTTAEEKRSHLPARFTKSHGRFGPYQLEHVMAARDAYSVLDNGDTGKVHVDLLREYARTATDPTLRGVAGVLAESIPRAETCTLEAFLAVSLSHAKPDERKRAVSTLEVADMLGRIASSLKKYARDFPEPTLPRDARAEITGVFAAGGTTTLREIPTLVNAAGILSTTLGDSDVERLSGVLNVDREKELDALEFAALLMALVLGERRRLNKHSSRRRSRRNSKVVAFNSKRSPSIASLVTPGGSGLDQHSPSKRRSSRVVDFAAPPTPNSAFSPLSAETLISPDSSLGGGTTRPSSPVPSFLSGCPGGGGGTVSGVSGVLAFFDC